VARVAIVTGSDSGIGEATAIALAEVMALELAGHGITVNSVAPGEIATAVVWLASEDAGYATGASFVIDGGLLLMAAKANADTAP
jgi:NAD(P)-dependent dehydrogenase (short-subunit alcohol dehydrogenase family)